ncbi:hypothetical protein V8C35DRAFT_286665 [Trichoderma chlorosporum]
MANPQPTPSATENRDADLASPSLPAVPRRVQELRNGPRKQSKARSREARSRDAAPKRPQHRRTRRWREEVISDLDDDETFNRHLAILKILRRVPGLGDHVPQLVSNNPVARSYIVKYPLRNLYPFEAGSRIMRLTYKQIQGIKSQLYQSVRAMYNSGVGYNIYPRQILLYAARTWDIAPVLFLGSVTSSDLLDTGELNWKEQRDRVCAQINRSFAPLEIWTFRGEAADLTRRAKYEMDWATSKINDNNAALDSAKADLTEAQAIMAEACQVIRRACAAMKKVDATAKNMDVTTTTTQYAWDRAQTTKEEAEKSLKKAHILNDRADALIQKYGNPEPQNGGGTKSVIPHSEPKPEDNVEMKDGNLPLDDITAKDEPIT